MFVQEFRVRQGVLDKRDKRDGLEPQVQLVPWVPHLTSVNQDNLVPGAGMAFGDPLDQQVMSHFTLLHATGTTDVVSCLCFGSGCSGEKGEIGEKGLPGFGLQGHNGKPGSPGFPGYPGRQGPSGPIGDPGLLGPKGQKGELVPPMHLVFTVSRQAGVTQLLMMYLRSDGTAGKDWMARALWKAWSPWSLWEEGGEGAKWTRWGIRM